jgi:hypothetical protein
LTISSLKDFDILFKNMIKENEGKITGDYIITDEVLGSGKQIKRSLCRIK